MEYMLARIDDAWLRKNNGEFTSNLLEAESFNSFEDALKHVTNETIVVSFKSRNRN